MVATKEREVFDERDYFDDCLYAGVEVKAGAGVGKDDFRHIKWFGDNLAKGRKFTGIVLYAGDRTLSFGEGLKAVPIAALWE